MKITAIDTVVVYARWKRQFGAPVTALGAKGIREGQSEHALVFVRTDEGITGIGEISTLFARRGAALARDVQENLAPALLDQDPRRIALLVQRMDLLLPGSEPAKAGVEMALWDILGKVAGLPVYQLLGGRVRDAVPLSHSIWFADPEKMAEFASARAAEGFRTVKVKVGQGADRDVAAVRLVREALGPGGRLRVDANMAWRTPKEAIAVIRRMQPYDLELVEQPLPARELDGMAEVRRCVDVPIMADESVWNPRDAMEVVRRGAADIVNVYVSESGGLLPAWRTFSLCELAGLPCMIGSMPEMGIGTAAQIHLGVAMTNLGPDSDTCGTVYFETDYLKTPLRIEGGKAYPPEGPGLGVDIDEDRLQAMRRPPD